MTFAACLPVILASEGKTFVIDQGGPTELGITQAALQAFLHRPVTAADVENLANEPYTVAALYQQDFYNPAHCPALPDGPDLMVFDESVNEGPARAIRHMQMALGVFVDGLVGAETLAAIAAMDARAFIAAIHDDNAAFYQALDARFPADERGWQARNDRTRDIALGMVA